MLQNITFCQPLFMTICNSAYWSIISHNFYSATPSLHLRSDILLPKLALFSAWDSIHGVHFWMVSCLEVCCFRAALVLCMFRNKYKVFVGKWYCDVCYETQGKDSAQLAMLYQLKKKAEFFWVSRLICIKEVKSMMENSDGLQRYRKVVHSVSFLI